MLHHTTLTTVLFGGLIIDIHVLWFNAWVELFQKYLLKGLKLNLFIRSLKKDERSMKKLHSKIFGYLIEAWDFVPESKQKIIIVSKTIGCVSTTKYLLEYFTVKKIEEF